MRKRSNQEVGTTSRCVAAVLCAVLASGTVTPTLAWAAKPAATKAAAKPAKASGKKDDKSAAGKKDEKSAAGKKDEKSAAGKKDEKSAGKKDDKKAEEAKRAEARKHYAAAEEKFKAGDFAGAFTEYKAADDILSAPITTYKMAVCLDKEDKGADAVKGYKTFLAANPPASMQEKIDDAKSRVAELEKKLPAALKVTTDPAGADVSVDGIAQLGATPLELKVAAGHHTLRITSPGYDAAEKELDAEGGSSQDVNVTLTKSAPAPVAAAAPPPPVAPAPAPAAPANADTGTGGHSNTAAYVLLGVAGAGVVVGSIFGVKALSAKSDFNNGTKTSDKADEVERNALISDMAFGAALTLGVTGTVLLLSNKGSDSAASTEQKHALQVAPFVTPHSAGAGAFVSF